MSRSAVMLAGNADASGVTVSPKRQLFDLGVAIWFMAAHVLIGALVFAWPAAATLHAWAIIAFGVWLAASTPRQSDVAILAAYVVGAEVLWRMAGAATFWEIGKYAVTGILLISFARGVPTRSTNAAIVYFALLLPSIGTLAQNAIDLSDIRDQISFNLSGPLTLAVAACFFTQLTLSRRDLGAILLAALGPVIAIASLTLLSTYAAGTIEFSGRSSNAATSGGFGPNQVSAVLGLGAVCCFLLLATQSDLGARRRGLLFVALVVCFVQSAMTFSRGGIYMSASAIAGAALYLLRDRAGRQLVVGSAVVLTLLYGFIVPRLANLTDGALVERFEDVTATGRWDLAKSDLRLWAEQPLVGVGPGLAMRTRTTASFDYEVAAHTEWTRLLAEHGVFGLISLVVLLNMMGANLRRARGPMEKAVVTSLLIWCSLFLSIDAMRIAAPAFLVGLTCATFEAPIRRRV